MWGLREVKQRTWLESPGFGGPDGYHIIEMVQERLGTEVCKRVHGGTNATVTHPRELCCAQAWLEYQTRS